jgi:hypothetical protein
MGNKLIDITGQVFGTRTVLGLNRTEKRGSFWNLKCSCGAVSVVRRDSIATTKACKACAVSENNTRHGMSHTPTHRSWLAMLQRCDNPNTRDYSRYGGRGISICEDWRTFENFLRDMGERPDGTTIDRIDCNGNYEPSNCRWATHRAQTNNRNVTRMITANGETMALTDWSRKIGIKPITLEKRIKSGWSDDDAINTPTMTIQQSGARPLV